MINRQVTCWNYSRPQPPVTINRNYYQQNNHNCGGGGGNGFWGGFLGGFLGGGGLPMMGNIFSGLFGGGWNMFGGGMGGMGGGMGTAGMFGSTNFGPGMGGTNPYGYLNNHGAQAEQPKFDEEGNLKKLFGTDYTIISEAGKFTVKDKDGNIIADGLSYADAKKAYKAPGTPVTAAPATTPANPPAATDQPATTPAAETSTSTAPATAPPVTPASVPTTPTKKSLPEEGWYNNPQDGINPNTGGSNNASNHMSINYRSIGEAMDDLIKTKTGIAPDTVDREALKAALIKKNPSVFDNDGKIKQSADWTKFEIPTYKWMNKNVGAKSEVETWNSNNSETKISYKNNKYTVTIGKTTYNSDSYKALMAKVDGQKKPDADWNVPLNGHAATQPFK